MSKLIEKIAMRGIDKAMSRAVRAGDIEKARNIAREFDNRIKHSLYPRSLKQYTPAQYAPEAYVESLHTNHPIIKEERKDYGLQYDIYRGKKPIHGGGQDKFSKPLAVRVAQAYRDKLNNMERERNDLQHRLNAEKSIRQKEQELRKEESARQYVEQMQERKRHNEQLDKERKEFRRILDSQKKSVDERAFNRGNRHGTKKGVGIGLGIAGVGAGSYLLAKKIKKMRAKKKKEMK